MAALAQPDLQETAIRNALATIPLPEGAWLRRLEFRNDSTGDPAVYVVYAVTEPPYIDENRGLELMRLREAVSSRLWDIGLDLPAYTMYIEA
jgi:hypothetical protein